MKNVKELYDVTEVVYWIDQSGYSVRCHKRFFFVFAVSPSHNQAMRFNCDGAVNAMAMNKDMTQVVVAGRTGKILHFTAS